MNKIQNFHSRIVINNSQFALLLWKFLCINCIFMFCIHEFALMIVSKINGYIKVILGNSCALRKPL